ncbi:MAG: hypothetical protein WCG81_00875 [Candidatus Angelobacter sp.]
MTSEAGTAPIDQLIIASPYEEPAEHWKYDRETRRFSREPRGIQPSARAEAKSYFTGEDKIIVAKQRSGPAGRM